MGVNMALFVLLLQHVAVRKGNNFIRVQWNS